MRRRLTVPYVIGEWAQAATPRRWNAGERRYWLSWFKRWSVGGNPSRWSIRHCRLRHFRAVVAISEIGIAVQRGQAQVECDARLDRILSAPPRLHARDKGGKRTYRLGKARPVGWLAHYTAACYHALAVKEATSDVAVCQHVRLALGELGMVVRDPSSRASLQGDWWNSDPELKVLQKYPCVRNWLEYVGMPARRGQSSDRSTDSCPSSECSCNKKRALPTDYGVSTQSSAWASE